MVGPGNAQDLLVAGEGDLHQDVALRHGGQHLLSLVLAGDVDAVADPLRPRRDHGLADVKAEVLGRGDLGGQLSGVQRHPVAHVQVPEEADHPHVEAVVPEGHRVVLGLDEIHPDVTPVPFHQLEPEQDLGEDHLRRVRPQHLVIDADGEVAGRVLLGGTAAQLHPELVEDGVELGGDLGHDAIHGPARQHPVAHGGEVRIEPDPFCEGRHRAEAQGHERFEVVLLLGRRPGRHLGQHLPGVPVAGQAELLEGGEEVVVARLLPGLEALHRPGGDDLVAEFRIGCRLVRRSPAGAAGRGHRHVSGRLQAQAVLDRETQQGLGRGGAGEVRVQVAALRHLPQEGGQARRFVPDRIEIAVDRIDRGRRRHGRQHDKRGTDSDGKKRAKYP
jgi:hypothetical protein